MTIDLTVKEGETGFGSPIRRIEDERMLTGKGRYVDDMSMPDIAYAHVVRSPHAHARILGQRKKLERAAASTFRAGQRDLHYATSLSAASPTPLSLSARASTRRNLF